jgi:hypothetical protein
LRKQFNFNGQQVWGEEVEFETEREGWNVYILHDGTKYKLKAIIASIARLEAFLPNGDPIYLAQVQNVVNADIPDSLKNPQR